MTDAGTSGAGGPLRPAVAAIVGIVAVIGLVAGVVGAWVLTTATDSERFERTTAELLQRDDISEALATRVVGETIDAIGLEDAAADLVPDALGPLVRIAVAGLRSRIESELASIIRTPAVAETIAAAAGRAHRGAVDVLEGRSFERIDVSDGDVRLNLLPLVARTIEVIQRFGLLTSVDVPELTAGDPERQREELAEALGRELPPHFAQPVVYRSERLDELGSTVTMVRDIFMLAKRTFWLLIAVGLGGATLSIWMSVNRLRTAAFLVAGLFGVTLVARLVVGRVVNRLPDLVDQQGAKVTVREVATGLEQSLQHTMLLTSIAALALLVTVGVFGWSRSR